MEKKYVVRGKVEGKQAVLHIMLTVSPAPAPQSSHYRLEVRARGHFGVKNERMLFLLLKGQQWQRREEKGVWRVRNVVQKKVVELNGHLPVSAEYEAIAIFDKLVLGQHTLEANVQGTRLGDKIKFRIPF